MKPATRHHLTILDRTIVQLLNERARLVRAQRPGTPTQDEGDSTPFVDDLLRRSAGTFPAPALREAFEAIDRGCREVQP